MRIEQLAVNSVSTGGDSLPERLTAYREAGFTNVEFWLGHIREYLKAGHTVAQTRRLLDDSGLRCIGAFECVLEAFSPPDQRSANHDQIVANAELLAELGATGMVVGTDGPSDAMAADEIMSTIASAGARVAGRIAGTGVALCLEFNWSPVVKSLRTAVEIVRRADAPNFGVLFDPAHYHCTPSKFEHITSASVPFIKHVHVDDMADKPGELSNCNTDRELPGQGCLDLRALFGAIEQYGYDGYFCIEMFSESLRQRSVLEASRLLYQSLLPLCAPWAL